MKRMAFALLLALATLSGCEEVKRAIIDNFFNVSLHECVGGGSNTCRDSLLHNDSSRPNACLIFQQGDTTETMSVWYPPSGGEPVLVDGDTNFVFNGDGNVVRVAMYFIASNINCARFTQDTNCENTEGCLAKLTDNNGGDIDFVAQGLCAWETLPEGCSMNPRYSTDGGYDGSDYDSGNYDASPKPDADIDGSTPDGDATLDGSTPDMGPTDCTPDTSEPCGIYMPGCNPGVKFCRQDGTWSECIGADPPRTEICSNWMDDDCDGETDEDPEGLCAACDPATLGQPCDTGLLGQCAWGSNVCVEGHTVCNQFNQASPTEWCDSMDNDCDGETDEDANIEIPCGFNNTGRSTLICEGGQINVSGQCIDPDTCINGATESRACGLNRRGNESRTCADGQWSAFNQCVDPDTCRDGDTENEACLAGELAGARERICANGQWGDFGLCQAGGVCVDETVQNRNCGLNNRGNESRTCTGGLWGDWAACVDPDICRDGDSENQGCGLNNRGSQSRTCTLGNFPDFGACVDPDQCTDGAREDQACGPNDSGTSSRTCNVGRWSPFGACMGADECVNGANDERNCGLNSRGTETRSCMDGSWSAFEVCEDPDVCTDDDTEDQACGINNTGHQTRTCTLGQWSAFGQCVNDANCQNGQTENRACGLNNRGTETRSCNNGQWGAFGACQNTDVCLDGSMEPQQCGLNGRGNQSRTCVAGQWGEFSACADPDTCEDGETRPCGPDPVGICRPGNQSCIGGQWAGECVGATLPAANDATCNGADDDCSGQTDEDYVPTPTACGVGACARAGQNACVAGQVTDTCVAGNPGNEVCGDGLDNDCDGQTNEGCPACVPDGAEVCDGRDNDCDGNIDGTGNGAWVVLACTDQVRDTLTGLLWDRQSAALGEVAQGTAAANCAAAGGKRLPTLNEVRRIIAGCAGTITGGACTLTNACNTDACENAACNACAAGAGPNGGNYLQLPFAGGVHEWLSTCGADGCAVFKPSDGGLTTPPAGRLYGYRCVTGP